MELCILHAQPTYAGPWSGALIPVKPVFGRKGLLTGQLLGLGQRRCGFPRSRLSPPHLALIVRTCLMAGEIDFLEAPWTVDHGAVDDYRRLYATTWNQAGQSFLPSRGESGHADGGWFAEGTSSSFMTGSNPASYPHNPEPVVWAAVVDRVGTYLYRIPAGNASSIWPGLDRRTAACSLPARPMMRPPNRGPPCNSSGYCALFLPNCPSNTTGVNSAGCGSTAHPVDCIFNDACDLNDQQGFCGNWFSLYGDTGQWTWPYNGTPAVVNEQPPSPKHTCRWTREMEASAGPWTPPEAQAHQQLHRHDTPDS